MRRLLLTVAGAAVVVASAAIASACGVSDDGEVQQIDSADLLGLDQTTTSTSTSTTAAETRPTPSTIRSPTTNTIPGERVELFFLDGDRLVSVPRDLAGTISTRRVLAALEAGRPAGDAFIGLRSVVPSGLVAGVEEPGTGAVTVDLRSSAFDQIDIADQRYAIAQIVLTLLRRPGVGGVLFTLDGEELQVPKGNSVRSEPGEPVTWLDYEILTEQPTSTDPASTTVPEPTVPPSGPDQEVGR